MKSFKVHFKPDDIEIAASEGEVLLDVARRGGLFINAVCGGNGVCGTCRVVIIKGEVLSEPNEKLSPEDFQKGCRLACQSRIISDLTVEVLPESRLETAVISREAELTAADAARGEAVATGWAFEPPLRKYYIELPEPAINDNISDLARLLRSLKHGYNLSDVSVDPSILKKLAQIQRQDGGRVTVTTLVPAKNNRPAIIRVEPGDTSHKHYSLAFDIGTTTVCGQLLDLKAGTFVAEAIAYNGQRSYGADVITRIAHSQKPGGLRELQRAVVATINRIIADLLKKSGRRSGDIGHITIAGNTVMTHLLLGLDPKYIRLAPYVPTASFTPPVKASSLSIRLGRHVYLSAFPSVASYVGGDIVSGVVAIGMHQRPKLTLYMDIGTNGEIVVGNADWMITAACSAGPAFEGGGIKHGMMAAAGAIEEIKLDSPRAKPAVKTIGGEKPRGICGSGLINIIARLLEAGLIGQNGKFNTELKNVLIRKGADGYEYRLVPAAEAQTGRDIVITEPDIDNLLRAKAAMYAGCQTLTESVGIKLAELEQVIIAGAFGSHIDIEKGIAIGLLPDIPRDRFTFVGNASLTGSRLTSFSTDLRDDADRVAGMMTNLELSERADYMDRYIAALFLPHTNATEFPSITGDK